MRRRSTQEWNQQRQKSRNDISKIRGYYQEDSYEKQLYKIISNLKGKPTISEYQIEKQWPVNNAISNKEFKWERYYYNTNENTTNYSHKTNLTWEVKSNECKMQRIEGFNKGGTDPTKRCKSVMWNYKGKKV